MGRPKRNTPGGMVYHVLNRSNARMKIFSKKADYEAFEKIIEQAVGSAEQKQLLSDWPINPPRNWLSMVNKPQTTAEMEAVQRAIKRGNPLGSESWTERIIKKLDLASTIRPRGRPRIKKNGS